MNNWVCVEAGSGYGSRVAWYQIIEGRLVLRDEGSHDNLAGNSAACDFEGMTLEEAQHLADVMNQENTAATAGHHDGCHLCGWSVEVEVSEPPDYLIYEDPKEAAVIRAALDLMHKRIGFGEFKAAVRAYEN